MINKNQLILFCKEQAIPWEVCKNRHCKKQRCLFSRAVKLLGTEKLFSPVPVRYSSATGMMKDREKLIHLQPIRTPVKIK